jgi:hypothetical protein
MYIYIYIYIYVHAHTYIHTESKRETASILPNLGLLEETMIEDIDRE